ncbi:MAG: O-antigen ligase family protein [Verrucomicrobia bacterium]|nr:O-antigen ligase family protein [Verrucomicrobiota bacterium]
MLISLYAIYQFISASDFVWNIEKPEGYRKRGSGTFICPNHLAGYLEMILPLSIAFTLTGRFEAMMKIFLGYATVVILAGIAVTVSRGGLLATSVALALVALWLLRQRDYWQRGLIVMVAALAILGGFYWKADIGPERRERIDIAKQVEDVRFQLWKPAFAMWKEHALFGVGLNHFDTRVRAYRPAEPALQARPERVHNDYLNTLVDWGLAGAALVLSCWALLGWQVARVWKYVQRSQSDLGAKRSNKAAFVAAGSIGLVAILVHSFFDFNMHIPANAMLAVTLFAVVSSHYRFAGEASWHTVRLPLRIPITIFLLAALGYLGMQSWRRTVETTALAKSLRAESNSDAQLAALQQAHSVEGKNFETSVALGGVYLERSLQGADGYKELAGQAIQWFERGAQLNPYDPHGWIGKGRALDWLGKHDEAAASFKKAEALDPNGYYTAAYLGWHYFQISNYDVAKQWLEKSRSLMADAKVNPIPHSYLKEIAERLAAPARAN